MRYDEQQDRWVANLLLQGFAMTLRLTFIAGVLAGVVGVLLGLARVSGDPFLASVSRLYIELVRNTPPLVFLFIFYFFISSQIMPLLGIGQALRQADPATLEIVGWILGNPRLVENVISGAICLAMLEGAYVAEIVRGGIAGVPRGQIEAAQALGLSAFDRMRDIVLPQALRRMAPPLANQFISLVKDSSIVSLISVQELTFSAQNVVTSTRRVFEVWILVAAMYFVVCFALSLLFRRLERDEQRSGR